MLRLVTLCLSPWSYSGGQLNKTHYFDLTSDNVRTQLNKINKKGRGRVLMQEIFHFLVNVACRPGCDCWRGEVNYLCTNFICRRRADTWTHSPSSLFFDQTFPVRNVCLSHTNRGWERLTAHSECLSLSLSLWTWSTLHDIVSITCSSCPLTASRLSWVTPSLPSGQPVPTWSWWGVYLSASSVLLLCCSSCGASWLPLSVHSARPLSAATSGLSRTASYQPVPVLLCSLPSSFLSNLLLFFLLLCSAVLRSIFPAWRSRISCVVHASSSSFSERSLRYTAWVWPRADPRLPENRSAWLRSLSNKLSGFNFIFLTTTTFTVSVCCSGSLCFVNLCVTSAVGSSRS